MRTSPAALFAGLLIGTGMLAPFQASATPIVRDFDNYTSPPVSCCYTSSEVRVAVYADLTVSGGESGRVMNASGWNNLQTSGANLYGSKDGFIDLLFTAPVYNLAFDLIHGNFGNINLTVNYFDSGNVLLEQASVPLTSYAMPGSVKHVIGRATNIAHVRITGASNMAIDTISFELAPVNVPEPASMALIGLAALGMTAARRRRA
ncbi:hypothetical protein MasN3_13440 [Massilia varians]|uniref:Ice-binding protein C-terminal domain-containing protein n=2 Tax=Massilia varians TaxID=457921 RepID=A0ABM8C3V3_9BURK|nr:hypothetical protein MasN3_13440 [Massilia varians]